MKVTERFLKYVRYDTQSSEETGVTPSTEKQKLLGRALADELLELGAQDARLDDLGYVYATIPASPGCESLPVIGLISHMDTAPAMPGKDVTPRVVRYDGGDLTLNEEKNIVMRAADFSHLANYIGQELVVTDGTTLLGADDKAGVAEILTAAERLLAPGAPRHGKIRIGITPDEEIGEGADHFDVEGFGADYAYTVDGGELGELEYENFNAADAKVLIRGVNIHPGEARGKLKNSMLMAMEFHAMLPVFENPACTDGYQGFFHLCGMQGDEEASRLHYIIRDHDKAKFEQKKTLFTAAAHYLNTKYGEGSCTVTLTDSYYNMKEQIEPRMEIIRRAEAAMQRAGVAPKIKAIRGGTDGARLSFMGLPCPNLSTGGHNFHGRYEYIPVPSMEKMVEVLLNLVSAPE